MTPTALLYDPDCGFCRVCVAAVVSWDRSGRLRPVALTSGEAERLLAPMPTDERMASWHLVGPDGRIRSAGAAFPDLLALLPAGRPLARLAARFPGGSERLYRLVAENRSALGRPFPEAAKRWADRVISESRSVGR